jgi:uncharacterized protein (TIGR00369 family)
MLSSVQQTDLLKHFMEQLIPFNKVLGLEITDVRHGFIRMEIPFREELIGDPFRRGLHGGVLSALIDTCGGAAVFTTLTPPHDRVSTIDLRVDYLRPGQPKRIAAEATVLRSGNRVASVDMRCFHPDAEADLVATGKGVYNVKRGATSASPPSS